MKRLAALLWIFWCAKSNAYRVEHPLLKPTATENLVRRAGRFLPKLQPQLQRMPRRNLHLQTGRGELMQKFHQMQRLQQHGKYRFSTFYGKRPRPKTLLPQGLLPMFSKHLMSTQEALQFGRVFRDQLAKQDMKKSIADGQGCTAEQLASFRKYFSSKGTGDLSFRNPKSVFTAMYIVTSESGDHNGAFQGLDSQHIGERTMCARLLQMSQHYNVVYKRVADLDEATEFIKEVKKEDLGKAIKHVTISGHGNPSTLVLGDDYLMSQELTSKLETKSKNFLKELKPALMHTGEARSTVFLDSCSTGKQPATGEPLARHVADALPGVEVHAFQDVMYPAHIYLQNNFWKDAKFECKQLFKGTCMKPSVFMAKQDGDGASLLETEVIASNLTDDEFEFYDGVTFPSDAQTCAEWCAMISECRSFNFVELIELEVSFELGDCTLHAPCRTQLQDRGVEGRVRLGRAAGAVASGIDGLMLD